MKESWATWDFEPVSSKQTSNNHISGGSQSCIIIVSGVLSGFKPQPQSVWLQKCWNGNIFLKVFIMILMIQLHFCSSHDPKCPNALRNLGMEKWDDVEGDCLVFHRNTMSPFMPKNKQKNRLSCLFVSEAESPLTWAWMLSTTQHSLSCLCLLGSSSCPSYEVYTVMAWNRWQHVRLNKM